MLRIDRIRPGAVVIFYLQNPKERYWGVLRSLDGTGASVLGLELHAFDDWLRQVAEENPPGITPSLIFFPMPRLEKILLDMASGGIPALADRFETRTGLDLLTYLGIGD